MRLVASTASQSSFFMRMRQAVFGDAGVVDQDVDRARPWRNASLIDSGEARSIATQRRRGEFASPSFFELLASRAARITRASRVDARACAHARPMPRLAPVTKAVLICHGLSCNLP